jgi:acetylglutamate kinase
MDITNRDWAGVLVQALPYFRHYVDKIVVVKYGGNAMLNGELKEAVLEDIVLLNTVGIRVVLVHGGGPEINAMLERVGKKSRFIDGLRYTDGETMEIVQMVLTGKLNQEIVGILLRLGGGAVGLSGVDAGLLRAKKIDKNGVDLGFVGEVTSVNPQIILSLLDQGFIPVISTVALGEVSAKNFLHPSSALEEPNGFDESSVFNINADTAAAKIAVALGAEKFVQLTNVPGVLRNVNDPTTLIKQIAREAVPSMMATGIISEGMIPKIECCLEALRGGVPRAHIIDGRVPHSLLLEMFSDRGVGTMIL